MPRASAPHCTVCGCDRSELWIWEHSCDVFVVASLSCLWMLPLHWSQCDCKPRVVDAMYLFDVVFYVRFPQLFASYSEEHNMSDDSEVSVFQALPKRLLMHSWLAFVAHGGIAPVCTCTRCTFACVSPAVYCLLTGCSQTFEEKPLLSTVVQHTVWLYRYCVSCCGI